MQFNQPDTVVPDPYNALDWNRYAYTRYNPVRYNDPSGHYSDDKILSLLKVKNWKEAYKLFEKGGTYEGKWGLLDILRMADDGDSIMNPSDGVAGSEGDDLGTFRLEDGVLYLDQGDNKVSALETLASGDYDDLTLVEDVLVLGTKSFTAMYIQMSSPLYTLRTEFHPENVDWVNVGLDAASVATSLIGANTELQYAKLAKNANTVLGRISLAKSLLVDGNRQSAILAAGGLAPGPVGGGFSLASLYSDLQPLVSFQP